MAPDEKPYRVYRGGRVKGKVPAPTKPRPGNAATIRRPRRASMGGGEPGSRRRIRLPGRPSWKRALLITVVVLLALFVAWAVSSYRAVNSGVEAANKRLQPG